MKDTSPSALAAAISISVSYASELLSRKRSPSRALAFRIWAKVGLKLGPIEELSDEDIETLARIEGHEATQAAA